MVQDTCHIVNGSRGATCHVQNESNMSSNGTHERHVETCEWVKIHGRWIRAKKHGHRYGQGDTTRQDTGTTGTR